MKFQVQMKVQIQQDGLARRQGQTCWGISQSEATEASTQEIQAEVFLVQGRRSGCNRTWRTAAAGHASESGCAQTPVLPPATASHSEDVSVSPLPIHVSASHAIKGTKEMTFKKVFLKYYDKK